MGIRGLPLVAGAAPLIGVPIAYWLGVRAGVLPACMPLWDGCLSISAAGRYMPGSLLFRAVMFPQAVVLVFLWYFAARWLRCIAPSSKAASTTLWSGFGGALALILYVSFLGTQVPFYEFMRRVGIYFFFLGTLVSQVTLAVALVGRAKRNMDKSLQRIAIALLCLCGLPLALGLLIVLLKSVLDNADFAENRVEWISAVSMQLYFIVLYAAWRYTGFNVVVKTD